MTDTAEAFIVFCWLLGFGYLCAVAVEQKTTVWALLARQFRDIARGLGTAFAALGLLPQPQPKGQQQARIRQLERELGIGQGDDPQILPPRRS